MTDSTSDSAALRAKLYQQFEELIGLVEPDAVQRYGLSWALLAHYVDDALAERKDLRALLGGNAFEVMQANHACHVSFMRSIFTLRSVPCFVEVVVWVYRSYVSRGFSARYFPVELKAWQAAIDKYISPRTETRWLLAFYQAMIDNHDVFIKLAEQPEPDLETETEYEPLTRRFLDALLTPSEHEAEELLRSRIQSAGELPLWWENVVTPSLRTIGRLWSDGKVSVAQEHIATAIAQRVMSRTFPRLPKPAEDGPTVAVVVSPGEQHEVGAAMVADALRICGFKVLYTGANTPIESILSLLLHNEVQTLLVSTTMPYNLDRVQELIEQVRRHTEDVTPEIIVGGQAYEFDPELYRRVGADRVMYNLRDMIEHLQPGASVA